MSHEQLQIGVMGACEDLEYDSNIEAQAEEIGRLIGESGHTLLFGAEKDRQSLSTAACRAAKEAGGLVIGVTYGRRHDDILEENVDVVISTGMERGGGREFVLALSCDVIIAIGGGAGTLNEITVAYMAVIPIVVLKGSTGWSDRLAGQFLDERKKVRVEEAETPEEAVKMAIMLGQQRLENLKSEPKKS